MDLHLENLMDGGMPKLKTYAWMKMTLHILGRLPHATTTGTTLPPGPEHTINAPGCRPAKELPQPTRKFRRGSTRRRLDGARHLLDLPGRLSLGTAASSSSLLPP